MSRHAYCIISHNEPEVLRTLVSLIDDSRNDIFLLIDKKADARIFEDIRPRSAGFYLAPRVNIHWGAMSLVVAEYVVLKMAHTHGPYAYYHLISGVDLPLHCQDWIHDYCDRHQGDEFIGFLQVGEQTLRCVNQHYFFLEHMRDSNPVVRRFFSFIRRAIIYVERTVGYVRHYPLPIKKGANWFSLTENAIAYLLQHEQLIWRRFNHIHTADEIVFHTIFSASPYMAKVHVPRKNGHSNMRLIDWFRGSPYVWQICDAAQLCASERFFARKFSSKHMEVVHALVKAVKDEALRMGMTG